MPPAARQSVRRAGANVARPAHIPRCRPVRVPTRLSDKSKPVSQASAVRQAGASAVGHAQMSCEDAGAARYSQVQLCRLVRHAYATAVFPAHIHRCPRVLVLTLVPLSPC